MSDLRVIATVDVNKDEAPENLGVQQIVYTKNPAIFFKGVAFSAENPIVPTSTDGKKMRICAPILAPSEVYRSSLGGHTVVFTADEIELMMLEFMQRYNSQENYFRKEHGNTPKTPSYILESWIVEDAETDKANTIYNLNVPKGAWVIITQFYDQKVYEDVVNSGATGLSIEGWLGHKLELSNQLNYADVLVMNGSKCLMLKRSENDTFEAGKFGFAGGKIEEGESAQEAAARELMEETGLTYSEIQPLDVVSNEDGTTTSYFRVDFSDYDGELNLSDEHECFEWMDENEIEDEKVILGQGERFKNLINKANKMTEGQTQKIGLPDGNYTAEDGTTFKVVNGEVVKPEEMGTEDPEKKPEGEEKTEEPEGEGVKLAGEGDPTDPTGAGVSETQQETYKKSEIDKMLTDLKEEISKEIADMVTELQGTGKSQDGETVEMSAQTKKSTLSERLSELKTAFPKKRK